jgi:cysteine-S-conjugate beta-lyase
VHHPALPGAPGHEHWEALCGKAARSDGAGLAGRGEGAGGRGEVAGIAGRCEGGGIAGRAAGLFSVVFDAKYTQAQVDAFVDGLKLFKIGFSWAGPMSLAVPYDMAALRSDWRGGCLVRFSLGLERVEDLIADLDQALQRMGSAS